MGQVGRWQAVRGGLVMVSGRSCRVPVAMKRCQNVVRRSVLSRVMVCWVITVGIIMMVGIVIVVGRRALVGVERRKCARSPGAQQK
jgi:hypothetical protein